MADQSLVTREREPSQHQPYSIQFWLLGDLQVWRGDVRLNPSTPGQRALSLLALLLTRREQYVAYDYIIEHLWPHLDPDAATHNVRVAVGKLRRWLEPDLARGADSRYLFTEPGGYRCATAQCYVDADAFNQAFQRGQAANRRGDLAAARSAFEQAHGLYRGEYLSDWPYADWALVTREQLREIHLRLLEGLAQSYRQLGFYGQAVDVCRQALAIDPLREDCVQHLMWNLAALGRYNEASTAYVGYEAVLRAELDVAPTPETMALRDQVAAREIAVAPPRAQPNFTAVVELPLVGREQALAALSAAWDGRPGVVLVAGEAGIGKTRLLDTWAATLDAPALWSPAREADAPFAAALNLVDAYLKLEPPVAELQKLGRLAAPLAERLPALRQQWPACPPSSPLPPDAEQARLHQALVAALRLAAAQPTLLILDDGHWASAESLAVLSVLFRSPPPNTLLIVAYRREGVTTDGPFADWLGLQQASGHTTEIELDPLTPMDVLEAVRATTNLPTLSRFSRRLHAVTAGHPLFLTETLRGLIEAGRLYRGADGVWHTAGIRLEAVDEIPLSDSLREAVIARAERVSVLQRQILDAAAVLRRAWRIDTLAAMLRIDSTRLSHALGDLVDRRLLAAADAAGAWHYAHPLLRVAIYTELPGRYAELLHRLAAGALAAGSSEDSSAMAAEIVEHLRHGAGDPASLAQWAVRAGQWAYQHFAHSQALRYFELAVDEIDALALQEQAAPSAQPGVDVVLAALEGLARVQQQTGHASAALSTLERALGLALEPRDRARLLRSTARLCERDLGAYDRALDLLDAAEEALASADSEAAAARSEIDTIRAGLHYWRGEHASGERLARLAIAEAPSLRHETEALWALAINLHKLGRSEEALNYYRQILQRMEASGDIRGLAQAHLSLGNGLQIVGRLAEALAAYEQAGQIMEQLNDRRRLSVKETNLGITLLDTGDLLRSEQSLRRATELAEAVNAPYTVAVAQHHLGKALALRGRWPEAGEAFEAAVALADQIEARVIAGQAHVHYGRFYWLQGDAVGARHHAQLARQTGDEFVDNFCQRESRLLLGEVCLAAGEIAAAEEAAHAGHAIATQAQQRLAVGRAERLLGRIAAAREDWSAAQHRLSASERIFRECSADIELGLTLLAGGQTGLHTDTEWQHERLVEARRLFRRARALPLLKQAEQALQTM